MTEEKPIKTLIVDDEESSRMMLRIFLSGICDCDMAENGKLAIEAIRRSYEEQDPYDLVCLDVMMPEQDGLETLQQIRELENHLRIPDNQRCKVIMTTTVSQVSRTMKAFHFGCNAYLVKPVDKSELLTELKKIPFGKSFNAKWRSL